MLCSSNCYISKDELACFRILTPSHHREEAEMIEEEAEPEDEETKIEHQIMELQAAASTEKKQ